MNRAVSCFRHSPYLLLLAFAVGCSSSSSSGTGPADASFGDVTTDAKRTDAHDAQSSFPEGGALPESEIVGFMEAANKTEVAAGQTASTQAVTSMVRSFAAEMVTDHSSAETTLEALASSLKVAPASSKASGNLEVDAQTAATMLAKLSGIAFDQEYINSQVAAHTTVLAEIDDVLLPSVTNAQLKSSIETAKTLVTMHLKMAKALQTQLADGGLSGGDASSPDATVLDAGAADGAKDSAIDAGSSHDAAALDAVANPG